MIATLNRTPMPDVGIAGKQTQDRRSEQGQTSDQRGLVVDLILSYSQATPNRRPDLVTAPPVLLGGSPPPLAPPAPPSPLPRPPLGPGEFGPSVVIVVYAGPPCSGSGPDPPVTTAISVEIGAGDTETLWGDEAVGETDPEESEAEGKMEADVALDADAEEPARLESDLILDALEALDDVDVLKLEDVALPAVASQRPAEAAASVLANTCASESAHRC